MKIVLLINFVSPYRIPLFELLHSKLSDLIILTSTEMGPDRSWSKSMGKFNMFKQKSIIIKQHWRHPKGFNDEIYIYVPVDTIKRLRQIKPNIVISHEFGMRSLQCLVYKIFNPKTKLIIWANISDHTEKNRGAVRLISRSILSRFADQIWVNGNAGARYIKRLNSNFNAIRIFPYPTDEKFIKPIIPKKLDSTSITLLTVGNLIERKGLLLFLNSLVAYLDRHPELNINYRIIGEGPQKDLIRAFPVPTNLIINLTGFKDYDELSYEYITADFFIFPTLADEWGVVVNEAMASGLPVIGSRYSQAVEEMVEESVTGWSFIPDDQHNTCEVLNNALSIDPNKYEKMRSACQAKADKINMENIANQIVQELNHL